MSKRIFTSESVTEGHPDKICDQISDGVLDAILAKDPQARVACECATTTGLVLVMGEITTNCYVDIAGIARDTITKIGYDNAEFGFDGRSCAVLTAIDKQSGLTLQNREILRKMDSSSGSSQRSTIMSGEMPMPCSSLTECCVGFVLCSSLPCRYGTSVTWM